MTATDFLAQSRNYAPALPPADLLALVMYSPEPDECGDPMDANYGFRESVLNKLAKNPDESDRAMARFLLEQDILDLKSNWGTSDSFYRAIYVLFRIGNPADALWLWRAKTLNFDTEVGVDIQLLVGGGVEKTLDFLDESDDPEAQRAAARIRECRERGDFNEMEKYRLFAAHLHGPSDTPS